MKNKPEEAGSEVKIRCGICGNGTDIERATTLRCSHTFCFQCIKSNHETAVKNKQSESDKLYCPRCAEITAVPDGSVEKIRPFYLCNRIKDLRTFSQMHRELKNNDDQASENTEPKVTIDTRSYTIEGPTLEDVEEIENGVAPSAQMAEVDAEEKKNGGRTYSCYACHTGDVAYYCFQCGQILCEACRQSHAENEACRSHYGIDISNQRIESLVCPTHNEFIRQFCAGCFEPVCTTCCSANHENHEMYEFCTPEEASQVMSEVGKRRTANEYVLQELDKLATKLATHLVTISNDVDTFVQKTRSSDDFVASLKGHVQQCLAEMQKELHKMGNGLSKNTHSLNIYEAIHGANIHVQGLGEFAIKYTISDFQDLMETVQYETTDIPGERKLKIKEQRDFCMAPIMGEQHRYECEEEQIGNAFDNEISETSEQTAYLTQLEENSGNSEIGGENESASHRVQMEQISGPTMLADDARSQTLIPDKAKTLNKVRDPIYDRATTSVVEGTPSEVNISNVEAETSESCDSTGMHQTRRLEEEDQQFTEVIVSETCEIKRQILGRNTTDTRISKNPSELYLGSTSLIRPATASSTQKNGHTTKNTDICEQQSTWKTHERLWSVQQSARSVEFLPSGNILAAGKNKLEAFDASGRKLPVAFDTSVLSDPWKLAVHRATSAVVVVDPTINAFAVFTPNSSDSERWSYENHCIAGIHVPMCAAFSDYGHVLLGTGSGRTLLKYSVSGELLWQRSLAHDCYYLTTDTRGRIISSGGGSVHIHDENGKELHPFPECKEHVRDPWGVCTDSENNIYVCELNRPVVTVFSSNGKYIRELDLNTWPRDIAVYDDRLLIASVHSIEMHQMKRE